MQTFLDKQVLPRQSITTIKGRIDPKTLPNMEKIIAQTRRIWVHVMFVVELDTRTKIIDLRRVNEAIEEETM